MEKDILLNEIYNYGKLMDSYTKHIIYIKDKSQMRHWKKRIKFIFINLVIWYLSIIVGLSIISGLESIFNFLDNFILNIINFSLILLFIFIYPIIFYKVLKLKKNKQYAEIEQYKESASKIFQTLKDNGVIIPMKYWNNHALSSFVEYLTTFRADTLKECVQIYELEALSTQQINQMKKMEGTLDRMDNKLSQINKGVQSINEGVEIIADITYNRHVNK